MEVISGDKPVYRVPDLQISREYKREELIFSGKSLDPIKRDGGGISLPDLKKKFLVLFDFGKLTESRIDRITLQLTMLK